MSRTVRSTRFWLGAAIATVALAGTAYATIPGGDGTIHGCYAKSGGTLRVIDASITTCKSGETALDWNQKGVPGPSGPQGQPGVSGYEIVSVRATREAGGPANEVASAALSCPGGKTAIGGGARVVEVRPDGSDLPANADVDVELQTSSPLTDGAGWAALAREDGNVEVRWGLRTHAICAVVE